MKKTILILSLFLCVSIYADYVDTSTGKYVVERDMGNGNRVNTQTGAYIQNLGDGNSVNTQTGEYMQDLGDGSSINTNNNDYYLNNDD